MNVFKHVVDMPVAAPPVAALAEDYVLLQNEAAVASEAQHHVAAASSLRKLLMHVHGAVPAHAAFAEGCRHHDAACEAALQLVMLHDSTVKTPLREQRLVLDSSSVADTLNAAAAAYSSLSFLNAPPRQPVAEPVAPFFAGKTARTTADEELQRKAARVEVEVPKAPPAAPARPAMMGRELLVPKTEARISVVAGGSKFSFGDKKELRPPGTVAATAQGQGRVWGPAAGAADAAAAPTVQGGFLTAGEQLQRDIASGKVANLPQRQPQLGLRKFQPPFQNDAAAPSGAAPPNQVSMSKVIASTVKPTNQQHQKDGGGEDGAELFPEMLLLPDGSVPAILQPCDPKLVRQICLEIVESGRKVEWDDIAGLNHAKQAVEEAVVWPLQNPELFTGVRASCRGLLLFGPPGTGKTMIARAIASRAECTFLNISSSSLMSKWVGDGEKMVRCLFAVAAVKQPSVVFIDEIDSLLSMRGEGEMDAVRRVKTEFLVQLDGVATSGDSRVLLIGATNRPEELDEAARRRLEKRLYIPLPDTVSRRELITRVLFKEANRVQHTLGDADFDSVAEATDGYSGADLSGLCREAAMGPLRGVMGSSKPKLNVADIRPVCVKDFTNALRRQKPSVGKSEVARYEKWNAEFGSFDASADDESFTQ